MEVISFACIRISVHEKGVNSSHKDFSEKTTITAVLLAAKMMNLEIGLANGL